MAEDPQNMSTIEEENLLHYKDVENDVNLFLTTKARETSNYIIHSEMVHESMMATAGSKWPASDDDNEDVDEHREGRPQGLQAFDIALNPKVEALMRAARYGPRYWGKKSTESSKNDFAQVREVYRPSRAHVGSADSFGALLPARGLSRRSSFLRKTRRYIFESVNKLENLKDEGPIEIPWLNERLATSCRSCRFELPMDLLELKKMTVTEYLLRFCKIPKQRQTLFKKLFGDKADKATGLLPFKELEKSLCNRVLANSVGVDDLQRLFRALNLTEYSTVNLKLFTVICALAERILYVSQVGRLGQVGVSRGFLESADFCALEWKLRGVDIDPYLRNLLYSLG